MGESRPQKSYFKTDWARIQIGCRCYGTIEFSEKCREVGLRKKKKNTGVALSHCFY